MQGKAQGRSRRPTRPDNVIEKVQSKTDGNIPDTDREAWLKDLASMPDGPVKRCAARSFESLTGEAVNDAAQRLNVSVDASWTGDLL